VSSDAEALRSVVGAVKGTWSVLIIMGAFGIALTLPSAIAHGIADNSDVTLTSSQKGIYWTQDVFLALSIGAFVGGICMASRHDSAYNANADRNLGFVLQILAVVLIVPAALNLSQYQQLTDEQQLEPVTKAMFGITCTVMVLCVVAFVCGMYMLSRCQ
jgi:uncharacterized membrane protein YidH (DUF202 family)